MKHIQRPGNTVSKTLIRSTSSVTDRRPKTRPPIAKPVRRSKSQHISAYKGGSFVTSIQHGGSVTLVSLGGENSAGGAQRTDQPHVVHHHHFVADDNDNGYNLTDNRAWPEEFNYNAPYGTHDISTLKEEVNGWHSGRSEISEFQGSHTLPRASGGGSKSKKINRNKDDSDIYTPYDGQNFQPTKTGSGAVRIRIVNGNIFDSESSNNTSDVLVNNLKNLDYKSGDENRIVEKYKRSHRNNQEDFEKDNFKSENLNVTTSKDTQTSLDFDSSCYSAINPSRNSDNNPFLTTKQNLNKRNLTLEELEIEGFDGPDNQSLIVNPIEIPNPNKGIVENGIEHVMESDVSDD